MKRVLIKMVVFWVFLIPYVRIACYVGHSQDVSCKLCALAPSSCSIRGQAGWMDCKGRGTRTGWPGAPLGWVARLLEQHKLPLEEGLDSLVRDTKCFLHGIAPILSNLFPFHYDSLTQVTWIWTCVHLLPVVGFLDGIEWKVDAKLDTPGHVDLPHFPLWSRWAPPLSRLECSHTYPWISCALGNAVPISAFQ